MGKKIKKVVKLFFPQELIREPLTFKMGKRYDVIPNIIRAKVTETIGELVVELIGKKENIEKGLKFLKRKGVSIESIEGDIIN